MRDPASSDFYPRAENIFLDSMDDLRGCSRVRASPYEAIRCAALVRKFILGGSGSLDRVVNRVHRLKFEYSASSHYVVLSKGMVAGLWLDPHLGQLVLEAEVLPRLSEEERGQLSEDMKPATGSVDKFLAHPVVIDGDRSATVKDVTQMYANSLGGVHTDRVKNELLSEMVGEAEPLMRQSMTAIGRIVHRALRPLEARLMLPLILRAHR